MPSKKGGSQNIVLRYVGVGRRQDCHILLVFFFAKKGGPILANWIRNTFPLFCRDFSFCRGFLFLQGRPLRRLCLVASKGFYVDDFPGYLTRQTESLRKGRKVAFAQSKEKPNFPQMKSLAENAPTCGTSRTAATSGRAGITEAPGWIVVEPNQTES